MQFPIVINPTDQEGVWLRPSLVASWLEVTAIIVATLGNAVFVSTWMALDRNHKFYSHPSTDHSLLYNIAFQAVVLCLLLAYLNRRGWKTTDLKLRTSWKATFQAIPLTLAVEVSQIAYWFIFVFSIYLAHKFVHFDLRFRSNLTQAKFAFTYYNEFLFLAFQILNAFSEELICIGYAFNQIASKKGPLVGLLLTLLLRVSYHTWQGPFQIFATIVLFLIFGLFYWRFKTLWPLILAHALYDLLPVSPITILRAIFSLI